MIPVSIPTLYKEDKKLVIQALQDNFVANGPHIELFEKEFASYCNRKYAVTCSNGTVALYLAVRALNLPAGSEVILPTMTILSCLTAIKENGLVPVFCDVDSKTWNVDFKSIREKITVDTSAVLVVDTYGLMADSSKLLQLKQDYPDLKVIEDASEAHGALHNESIAGSLGDISTFSFYSNKIITTGEGGCVLTNDEDTYKTLLGLRNLNFTDRKKYIHSDIAFNFRLTNLQCCIGLGQLHNIDKTLRQRRRIGKRYSTNLKQHPSIQIPVQPRGYKNVYWYYAVTVKSNHSEVLQALTKNGIDYRHFFHPLHKQPFVNSSETLPNSEYAYEHGILLPTYTTLTNQQIDFISNTILQAL